MGEGRVVWVCHGLVRIELGWTAKLGQFFLSDLLRSDPDCLTPGQPGQLRYDGITGTLADYG